MLTALESMSAFVLDHVWCCGHRFPVRVLSLLHGRIGGKDES
jgi:hypothetical protein